MIPFRPVTAYGESMHEILEAGIEFILWLQQFQSPHFRQLFLFTEPSEYNYPGRNDFWLRLADSG